MASDSFSSPPIFVADHPALDFVNSWAKPGGVETDWLADGRGLVNWLLEAKLGDPRQVRGVADSTTAEELDGVAEQARTLRQWLRDLLDKHCGKPLARLALSKLVPLNELLAEDDAFRQIETAETELKWKTHRQALPLKQSLLLPVADAIGDLLTQEDFSLIRFCEGTGCVLVFLDRTKSHARRWCSMAGCGNRAKAAAHRAKIAVGRRA